MSTEIPITDFDRRWFPDPTDEDKKRFIINTHKFDKVIITEDQYHTAIMTPSRADPTIAGHLRAINLVVDLAKNPQLLPLKAITTNEFDATFSWFKRLHKNILYNLALKGKLINNNLDYPQQELLGTFRTKDKIFAQYKAPNPTKIINLLTNSLNDYTKVYTKYHDTLNFPANMDITDWRKLERAAHTVCLDICAIQPFEQASNQVARLTENLLRLNVGLKFKTYQQSDPISDINSHQSKFTGL